MIRRLTFAMLLAAGLAGTGCREEKDTQSDGQQTPNPKDTVATVDGQKLSREEMDRRAKAFYEDERATMSIPAGREEEAMEYFRRRAVTVFVFKAVTLDEARQKKIVITEDDRKEGRERLEKALKGRGKSLDDFFAKSPLGEKAVRQDFEDGLVIDKLLKQEVMEKIEVSDKEIEELFGRYLQERVDKRNAIDAIHKQLLAGSNFVAMATARSDCPSKTQGGDLGVFERGKMDKTFEDAAFSQKVGEIGPVIQTRFGFHIIKVTAHNPAKPATDTTPAVPETVQASHILLKTHPPRSRLQLHDEVRRAKYNKAAEDYYKKLKAKHTITSVFKDLVLY